MQFHATPLEAIRLNLTAILVLTALGCGEAPADRVTSPDVAEEAHELAPPSPAPKPQLGLVWPNRKSRANSDPWLVEHHDRLQRLRPNVLVLLYANPATLEGATKLVHEIVAGFAEASRVRGNRRPQLTYRTHLVDLRDGVDGRPPAPPDFPFENSTLYPRTLAPPGSEEIGRIDYAQLFSSDYARYLGYRDWRHPGRFLDLCTLIDRGLVHEVWLVASGDVPDVTGLEVASIMQNYDAENQPIPGSVNRCANGCVGEDVPFCGRSIHIGAVNYNRGPGCFLHSKGHDVEFGISASMPAMARWFLPFARFDLDTRYGLPFANLYGLGCLEPPCVAFPEPDHAQFVHQGVIHDVEPYDPACGNVHFAPTGVEHFDYFNPNLVLTSCDGFGRHRGPNGADTRRLIGGDVEALPWNTPENARFGDCGGEFLVWWYQRMPGYRSGQTFDDGSPMQSIWPFMFY